MNIDELKDKWHSIEVPPVSPGADEREIISRVESGRVTTLRDHLCGISRGLTVICVLGIFVMVPYLSATPTVAILAMCFFIFLGLMHYRAYRKVRRINFSQMTVRDAMMIVCNIESDRIRHRAMGIALGLPLVLLMTTTLWDEYGDFTLYGCIVGAVAGVAIGLYINHRSVTILKEMKDQLRS